MFDDAHSSQLELALALKEQPYFIRCANLGATPTLHLTSTIFRNVQQLERENRVNSALRRENDQGWVM